jgi:hypothetical protein
VLQHLVSGENIQSPSFTGSTTAWKVSKATNDGVICPSTCQFQFTGGPKEKSKLTQTFKLPAGFKTNVGDTLRVFFSLATATPDAVRLTAKLTIGYTDGTPPTVISLKPTYFSPANYLAYYSFEARTQSKKIGALKIQFLHKSSSGAVSIYSVDDDYESVRVAGRSTKGSAGVLPLPSAPTR